MTASASPAPAPTPAEPIGASLGSWSTALTSAIPPGDRERTRDRRPRTRTCSRPLAAQHGTNTVLKQDGANILTGGGA
jgi:hypothetical protein